MSTIKQPANEDQHWTHNTHVPSLLETTLPVQQCGELLAKCLHACTHSTLHNTSTILTHQHPVLSYTQEPRLPGGRVSKSSAGHYKSQIVDGLDIDTRSKPALIDGCSATQGSVQAHGKRSGGHHARSHEWHESSCRDKSQKATDA